VNISVINQLSNELNLKVKQIQDTLKLLQDANTVPFIARYRKEVTGGLDEEQIRVIEKQYKYFAELEVRKVEIAKLITEREMMTDEINLAISAALTKQKLEDIYLPFKEKKKTKATAAIKAGLQPLATFILTEPLAKDSVTTEALKYINDELAILSIEDAITGAKYIIAENIADNSLFRERIRDFSQKKGSVIAKLKKGKEILDEKEKFTAFYDYEEALQKIPGHRIFALNRAEKEGIISIKIDVDTEEIFSFVESKVITKQNADSTQYIEEAIRDGYKRLIKPSIERELRNLKTESAEERAYVLFAKNLEKLFMEKPLKGKRIMAIDPAFRSGCKIAIIDEQADVVAIDIIYPTEPRLDIAGATKKLLALIKEYNVEQIVIGNGTASRETDDFTKQVISDANLKIPIAITSEAGASVYSASKIAQVEFPDLAVEQRSAVSIARRVQDPMAELVKIDPKSIGVGQYQHDVNQKVLGENLEFTIVKNVNIIGVDVNTASAELLQYVSGLNKKGAAGIMELRNELSGITSRLQIKKAKGVNAKSFEQAVGFLKVLKGKNILDETFIHPENYDSAKLLMKELSITQKEIGSDELKERLSDLDEQVIADKLNLSLILTVDLLEALKNPNIDPREKLSIIKFSPSIKSIDDIVIGKTVEGIVRNIVDFGAFIDIGIKNDGLVHISEVSNNFVSDITTVLEIGDIMKFKVIDVNIKQGRVALSLKDK